MNFSKNFICNRIHSAAHSYILQFLIVNDFVFSKKKMRKRMKKENSESKEECNWVIIFIITFKQIPNSHTNQLELIKRTFLQIFYEVKNL